jgi:hypothetical protein
MLPLPSSGWCPDMGKFCLLHEEFGSHRGGSKVMEKLLNLRSCCKYPVHLEKEKYKSVIKPCALLRR